MTRGPGGISRRAGAVEPFHVMRLLARAREMEAAGRRVIHMEIGEPDFPTPRAVVEAGRAALAAGYTHYTPARGLPALREAIAHHYLRRYGVEVDPERILITPGASGALQLVLAALLDPGDRVLMADPGYPCNRHMVRLFGGEVSAVPVGPETNWQLTAGHLEQTADPAVRVVMVATPANPTGTLLAPDELAALHRGARERGAALVVDEIYQGIVYGAADHTALALGQDGLYVVNSFSKFFGMTGWRLGWLVAPMEAVEVLDRLAQNLYLAPPTLSQHAALAAFAGETLAELEARRQELARRRDVLLPGLEALGFRFPVRPEGAFYLYGDCSALSDDSEAFAAELLEREAVAVTPGRDFGANAPERYLRFAYTTGQGALAEGVERIGRFLRAGA